MRWGLREVGVGGVGRSPQVDDAVPQDEVMRTQGVENLIHLLGSPVGGEVEGNRIVRLIHLLRVKKHLCPVLPIQDNLAKEREDVNELPRNLPAMLVGTRQRRVALTDGNHPYPYVGFTFVN